MSIASPIAALYERGHIVKVCGLREPEHAVAAAEAGADILGFIFAPARRQVTAEVAQECIMAARQAKPDVLACGVFVNAAAMEIAVVVRGAGLDMVQLSGSEPPEFMSALPVAATRAIHPKPGVSVDEIVLEIGEHQRAGAPPAAFLLDAFSPKGAGGTGEKVDWGLAAAVNARVPVMLAGGLSPNIVAEAIQIVRPVGVDVSSGVEIDGRKSGEQIHAFVAAAQAAFARQPVTATR